MKRAAFLIPFCGAAALALMAANAPAALSRTDPGLWEMTGIRESKAPVRQCVAKLSDFAALEHRGRACTQTRLKDTPSSVIINYTCSAGDFGRTKIDVLTPRSLRVDTQGISDGQPFAYLVQAHRVGDCGQKPAASGH
jgi:hypothetical protein